MSDYLRNRTLGGAVALLATALLSGCGESTNIEPENAGTVSACSSLLGASCVTGRLIDDAAFNVDYECASSAGTVRSVTASDGGFSCPNGSEVTFSLVNPDTPEFRIVLGSLKVTAPARIYGENSPIPIYFYVTPRTLAGDAVGAPLSSRAINITRLLQTLSTDPLDAALTEHLPTRRVVISDEDKRKINDLNKLEAIAFNSSVSPNPAAPAAGSFDEQVAPFLTSLTDTSKHQLISGDAANDALYKGIYSTVAGFYLVPGGSVLSLGSFNPNNAETDADTGSMVGYDLSSGDTFIGALYALVDRRGRLIGNGVYSFGSSSDPEDNWAVWSDPQPMDLTSSGTTRNGFMSWPVDGSLTAMVASLQGAADIGKLVRITRGVMRREAVAGSEFVYSNLFQETGNSTLYGRWALGSASNASAFITDGAYTFERTVSVATWMNPALWQDTPGAFPLPITVSIYNSDYNNAACNPTIGNKTGCKIADLRMVILKDGNIISDRFKTCGDNVDPETLVVNGDSSKVEIPLGTVANILDTLRDNAASPLKTMTLLAMLPKDVRLNDTMVVETGFEEYIPYLQFGSNLGENSLLRVDAGSNQFQMYGFCGASQVKNNLCDCATAREAPTTAYPEGRCPSTSFEPGLATWANNLTFMRAIKANDTAPDAASTELLEDNSGGLLRAIRTPDASCL